MKYFSSVIADKRLSDFQKYDSQIKKFDNRLELVQGLITGEDDDKLHEFFTTYFADYYNASPSQNGYLSEDDAVCKTLEGLGTYLLNAKDIESNRKVKYRFWKSEKEFKQYKESSNVNTSTLEAGLDEGVEVIDMFYTNDEKNFKLDTNQRLFAKDKREIKEVSNLQSGIELVKSEGFIRMVEKHIDEILPIIEDEKEVTRLKAIRRNVENYLQKWASTMADNQILIKEAIKKPIRFKSPMKDEGVPNKLDAVLFSDEESVKTLFKLISRDQDLMSDLGIIIYDFNKLIEEVEFTSKQQAILELFKQGVNQRYMPDILGIKSNTISETIGRMSQRGEKDDVKDLYKKSIKKTL